MLEARRIISAMNLEWDGKIGPAAIIGGLGSLGVLVTIGIAWGSMNGKIDSAAVRADEAKTAAQEVSKSSSFRDQRIAMQAERLGKIETSIQFIVPALQRIESKLDAQTPH